MKKQTVKRVLFFCILLALVLTMLYSGLRILESTVLHPGQEPAEQETTKTIIRNGIEYFPRQDVTVMMVLGIDKYGPVEPSDYYRNDGAADSVMLLVFDETNEACTVLYLNRDTMVDMNVLGLRGEYAGTAYGQLALAHTYGTGLKDSCENVANTLMNFLHGLTVDHYLAMNMDALPILNDAVGGVTVHVTEDFSAINPSITIGELTLRGDQVIDYVRTRKDVGDQKNVTRMERQKEYVNGFMEALHSKADTDVGFLLSTYDEVLPYIVTDCSADVLADLLDRYADYAMAGAITLQGENIIENGHYAFYPDADQLEELVLELFYRPKK